MKRLLAIVLTVVILVGLLTGCSKTDNERAVGKWITTINFGEIINDMLGQEATMDEYFEFQDTELKLVFKFNDDNTYTLNVDEDSFNDVMDSLKDDFKDGMKKYLEELVKASGVDMTVDEFLAAQGVTIDELVEQSFDANEMKKEFGEKAKFDFKDGKFYSFDEKLDEKQYMTYEFVDDNTIKFVKAEGFEEDEDTTAALLPMTLVKEK